MVGLIKSISDDQLFGSSFLIFMSQMLSFLLEAWCNSFAWEGTNEMNTIHTNGWING